MKGMVFREFLNLVESKFGEDTVDDVIEAAELASGGSYTSVGTYDHGEMVALVVELSKQVDLPVVDLLHAFARHLIAFFAESHPHFFAEAGDVFTFIENVHEHIHVEVRKLYPQAELPHLRAERLEPDGLDVRYRSARNFEDLAHGLMLAAGEYFGEPLDIVMDKLSDGGGVRFQVTRRAA
ncbi:MAG: heme NO-binding domain-containing protein [Myxococcota bacterium]